MKRQSLIDSQQQSWRLTKNTEQLHLTTTPQTRHSLILRLRDRDDAESWREFAQIYEPIIYRVAMQRGMQHADALELVQRVLLAVARAVDRFEPDSNRGRFRTWLYRITHNEFCKEYAAARKQAAAANEAVLQSLPSRETIAQAEDFSLEYRRAVFRWAANIVKTHVKPSTWQAFWRSHVDGVSVETVSEELGLSVGAVYIARSRVMAKLQTQAAMYEGQDDAL